MSIKYRNVVITGFFLAVITIVTFILYTETKSRTILRNEPAQSQGTSNVQSAEGTSQITKEKVDSTVLIDKTKLPIGDGKYGKKPQVGYIYSCQSTLNGPGAFKDGPWIDATSGTWNSLSKTVSVDGKVKWSNASFVISTTSQTRELVGNGLPLNHGTGIFPIGSSDDAYLFDRNPNSIRSQKIVVSLPLNPKEASQPSCLPMGAIGYSTNGVAIFNALDAGGRDAAAHEIQDECNGHPEKSGSYHYHDYSDCVSEISKEPNDNEEATLIGYALDGFGIYKYHNNPTNSELDACHGKVGQIMWDGIKTSMYHYVVTSEYPYTLGCYVGNI